MKQMTMEEFSDRTNAVLRAHQIFIESGMTNNITVAFDIYQKVLADRDRETFITSSQVPSNISFMDRYVRPNCPVCGSVIMFNIVSPNAEGINTRLLCTNKDCDSAWDSEKTLDEWMKILERKPEGEE